MNVKIKFYFQLALLMFSLVMSVFSFVNEGKEFYPFFYWKLYTKPLGVEYKYKNYRLYGVTESTDTIRIGNNGYYLFDKDDYSYFLDNEARSVLKKEFSKQDYIDRVKGFAKSIGMSYEHYLIVEEEFNPLEFYKDNKIKSTKVIFSTK